MRRTITLTLSLLLLRLAVASPASAAAPITCSMRFDLHGWSFFYQTSSGRGRVTCSNGQAADVEIAVKGGGVTVGKSDLEGAIGNFTHVYDIDEIFGAYARAEAHAGAVKSASAQALTKGEVSLTISGRGRGWDLGVSFGSFRIERAR